MGEVIDPVYRKIATRVFHEYPSPLLKIKITPQSSGIVVDVSRYSLDKLDSEQASFCLGVLEEYSRKGWKKRGSSKKYRWDIAMLVDPEESVPPSNKGALTRFIKAGEKLGIKLHTVTASDLIDLNLYDGLFIRETTAIDHHTYRLSRKAEQLGLAVMDDPDSILRCCNKVYLHDAFNYKKIPSPKTCFISNVNPQTLDKLEHDFGYPVVLKMPEGSFSKGVFKVETRQQLIDVATTLLNESALVLAQEFLLTEYDWRIGVINGRALYACRYYMARNHWQIYNHGSQRHFSGGFDALPTFEVPKKVLNTALKAAAVVGNGLYGIDVKAIDGQVYVLEVNDNPSIDHGIEDKYLSDELYMQVMYEFLRRLELRGR